MAVRCILQKSHWSLDVKVRCQRPRSPVSKKNEKVWHFVPESSSGARSSCGIFFRSNPWGALLYAGGKIRTCCLVLWLFFLVSDFCFLSTSQEIGWEERLRNDLFCVEWDVKPELNQSMDATVCRCRFSIGA